MPGRRSGSGWKASSLRRGRGRGGSGPVTARTANDRVGGGRDDSVSDDGIGHRAAAGRYARRPNPYKPSSQPPAPRARDSLTRDIVLDEDLGAGDAGGDLGDLGGSLISLGGDDDDLGLDNILSSITNNMDSSSGGGKPAPSSGGSDAKTNSLDALELELGANGFDPCASPSTGGDVATEKKEILDLILPDRPNVSQVNFGDDGSQCEGESHPARTSISNLVENDSPVFTEDNDTLWTDGSATREHKRLLLQSGSQGPAFSSGGFNNAARVESMTGPSFQTEAKSDTGTSSLVDSIIDDISMSDSLPREEPKQAPSRNPTSAAFTSPRTPRGGRFSSGNRLDHQSRLPRQPGPATHDLRDAPQSEQSSLQNSSRQNSSLPSKVGGVQNDNREAETMSTVTDPSESPVIYTYRKDDDSVSQITSSLAGNSFGSSHLQNVPTNFGNSRFRKIGSNGLSWMDNGSVPGGLGGRRKIHRKGGAFVPGPYGRNHGLCSPKSTPSPPEGSGRNSSSRSGCSAGSVPSYDGGRGEPDEIAYARNVDGCGPSSTAGRRPKRRPTPTGPAREEPSVLGNGEDLSTVESSQVPYIDTNVKSNVSRLGMGGVSCGAQSVSETTAVSESSSSSAQGLFQRLAMLAWKAQHHAGRFFFPTSPEVAQRKKFDRCDSVDELANILVEEGSGTLSHRKPSRGVRHGGEEYDEEEDIDYFSRVMTGSNNLHGLAAASRKPSKKRERRFWNGSTARVSFLVFALTFAFSYYKKPKREIDDAMVDSKQGRAGVGGRYYDTVIQEERHQFLDFERDKNQGSGHHEESPQVFEYREYGSDILDSGAGEEVVIADDVYPLNEQEEISRAGRLGHHMDNSRQEARNQILDVPDAKVDNVDLNGQLEVAGVNWLGRPKDNNMVAPDMAADGQNFQASRAVQLPSKFEALANVDDVLFQRGVDIPFYWHVPRSGGGTMNDVLGSCLHLTLAADAGVGTNEETLKVLNFSHQVSYVNVDTSTHQGISRAKKLNLASSGLADVVISPLLHEASSLFTSTRRGRLFTVFRHPVERAASLFYFIQETQWQQPGTRNDQFADITIEQFYKKGFAENNWMTRFLTNELTKGELTEKDLRIAKEVLRQKCLVGLLEEKGESFERIQQFFGWRPKNEEEHDCLERKMEWAWPMKHNHPTIEDGTQAWRSIVAANKFDLRLYEYAQDLFVQQGQQLFPR